MHAVRSLNTRTQIIYRNTGRFGLVTCALLSFVTLTWGMWLFTIVMPAFYWFGGPAIFIIFYTACHCACFAVLCCTCSLEHTYTSLRRAEFCCRDVRCPFVARVKIEGVIHAGGFETGRKTFSDGWRFIRLAFLVYT